MDGDHLTLGLVTLLAAAATARRQSAGSASTPAIHAMKTPPWTVRLQAGTTELNSALKAQDRSRIVAGLDDVSFWIGRTMCDAIAGGEGVPQNEALFGEALEAVVGGRRAIQKARVVLGSRAWIDDYSRGSTNVATTAGYHRTAIASTGASGPLRHLLAQHPDWVRGRVLDFGTGKGRDCKALGKRKLTVVCYDPHHPDPKKRKLPGGTFDLVLAAYVVNVLPKAVRSRALKEMASKVKSGGVLVVAARGCGDTGGRQTAQSWTSHSDGHAQFAGDGELQRFQRFFNNDDLARQVRTATGKSFTREQLAPTSSDLAMVAYRKGGRGSANTEPFRFSGLTCPSATSDLVDWSTDNWWHPVPVAEIEWEQFRDVVEITPESVTASGYLGWEPDWMPFAQFLASEPGGGTHAWFKGTLPSGIPMYVWVGSGIEHWWTPGGQGIDPQDEQEILDAIYDPLEQIAEQRPTTLQDTQRLIAAFQRQR